MSSNILPAAITLLALLLLPILAIACGLLARWIDKTIMMQTGGED